MKECAIIVRFARDTHCIDLYMYLYPDPTDIALRAITIHRSAAFPLSVRMDVIARGIRRCPQDKLASTGSGDSLIDHSAGL